jgi:lipoprotein-anchoring transpeptidase ErfK/SrfK
MSRNTKVFLAIMATLVVLLGATSAVVASTLEVRYARDVNRMVFNDNTGLLEELRQRAGLQRDSLEQLFSSAEPPRNRAYIVVSIEDHRLWYRSGDSVIFTTEVATGSGKILERSGGDTHWRFETPRGRLVVESKETDPVWVAPDWHYVEEAQRRGLGVVRLARRQQLPVGDGSVLLVAGSDVVKRFPDGRQTIVDASEGNELVAGGNIVIPPFGTNQRKYRGVLGGHRLNLGDGYALHGTNKPETIGRSVSHGCVRLRNEDIAKLYEIVPIGTPVFIY